MLTEIYVQSQCSMRMVFLSTVRAVQYFHRAVKLYEWKILSIFYGSINYTQGADRILV